PRPPSRRAATPLRRSPGWSSGVQNFREGKGAMFTRRAFLKNGSLAMFGVGAAPSWLARAAYASTGSKKILVTIFQRGAADGLNIVVPFGESHYYELRPTLAIPANSVLDLNGFFGLHPSLAPLKGVYDAKA